MKYFAGDTSNCGSLGRIAEKKISLNLFIENAGHMVVSCGSTHPILVSHISPDLVKRLRTASSFSDIFLADPGNTRVSIYALQEKFLKDFRLKAGSPLV
ncbi:MAG: hypothetical protein ACP5US_12530 [Candidatus Kryptoniota bacterium]